jgi:hypothetical protein
MSAVFCDPCTVTNHLVTTILRHVQKKMINILLTVCRKTIYIQYIHFILYHTWFNEDKTEIL